MIRAKCEKCGQDHQPGEPCAHANDNQPFDEKTWRKNYMRPYMQKVRALKREAKRRALEKGGQPDA